MHKFFVGLAICCCSVFGTMGSAQVINTCAGNGTPGHTGDGGAATLAEVESPGGIAVDDTGNVYIADLNAVRKISPAGIITTVAGTGIAGFSGDGGLAIDAQLTATSGVAIDRYGDLFIADFYNQVIRKVNAADGIISTYAGNGGLGYTGDGGAATNAEFWYPADVGVDTNGNLYIVDQNNNVVRMVNSAGIISTIAGTGTAGYNSDGIPATAAQLNFPEGIAVTPKGDVFIADLYNARIRKIPAGTDTIVTVAGNGLETEAGDGGQATAASLFQPDAIALDSAGSMYISDESSSDIRKVFPSGVIMTIGGDNSSGYGGDGGPATAATLCRPDGIGANAAGDTYVADYCNARVRLITGIPATPPLLGLPVVGNNPQILATPNPSTGLFSISLGGEIIEYVMVYDENGRKIFASKPSQERVDIDLSNFPPAIYFIKAGNKQVCATGKVLIIKHL